jgi:hypothetical protein
MIVLGRPVWVQALCQLVEAEDCRAHLDDRMASIDFLPERVNRRSAGDRFLEDMMDGSVGQWAD